MPVVHPPGRDERLCRLERKRAGRPAGRTKVL